MADEMDDVDRLLLQGVPHPEQPGRAQLSGGVNPSRRQVRGHKRTGAVVWVQNDLVPEPLPQSPALFKGRPGLRIREHVDLDLPRAGFKNPIHGLLQCFQDKRFLAAQGRAGAEGHLQDFRGLPRRGKDKIRQHQDGNLQCLPEDSLPWHKAKHAVRRNQVNPQWRRRFAVFGIPVGQPLQDGRREGSLQASPGFAAVRPGFNYLQGADALREAPDLGQYSVHLALKREADLRLLAGGCPQFHLQNDDVVFAFENLGHGIRRGSGRSPANRTPTRWIRC